MVPFLPTGHGSSPFQFHLMKLLLALLVRAEIGDDDNDVGCGVSDNAAAHLIADLFED